MRDGSVEGALSMRGLLPRGDRGWARAPLALARAGVLACVGAFTIAAGAGAAVSAIATASNGASAAAPAKCPLKSSSSTPAGDAWAFHDSAVPSSPQLAVSSSYVHGRGGWGGGHGSGTICLQHSSSGGGSHEVVLAVAGSARVYPGVTQLGHRGVRLTLHVSVAASDDQSCPAGSHGSVTLFASYYELHRDSLQLRFGAACAAYADTFSGSQLSALIAENGHQVN